jgi:SNF2 family DNA or RNA helicase
MRSSAAPNLTALVRLRLFCAHPWAAGKLKGTIDPVACSPKLERCLEILEEIAAAGEKALVFTSFNETADIIEATASARCGLPAAQINGQVPVAERQPLVDAFTAIAGPAVLVLNPKAAGTGLNIASANHVIHYNLEWNPAVEDQASARSHRRGQSLPVTVHRLFYSDTVEEIISERMARKRLLADSAVVGASGTEDDLADIVKALQRSPLNPT